nr:diguanylate cyclase [Zoogloeaceae bacterium]
LGRLGGDEFIVIGLVDPPAANDPDEAVKAMRSRLKPLLIGAYHFGEIGFNYSGASFGIASVDPSVSSPQAVLKEADRLMYADKQTRRALGMT